MEERKKRNRIWKPVYETVIFLLVSATVTLAALHLAGVIDLEESPYFWADISLHALLWADYLIRLFLAKHKGAFFKKAFDELVSLLPFSEVLTLLHVLRLLHILRLVRLLKRLLRKRFGRFGENISALSNTNGYSYVLCFTFLTTLTAAFVVGKIEQLPYWETLIRLMSFTLNETTAGRLAIIVYVVTVVLNIAVLSSAITCFSLKRQQESKAKTHKENDMESLAESASIGQTSIPEGAETEHIS